MDYKTILLKAVYVLCLCLKFKLMASMYVLRKANDMKINNICTYCHNEISTGTGLKVLFCPFP